MNKAIYDTAFNILSTHNDFCNALENIGLRFEYGDGFVGKKLLSLINDAELIVRDALGLHEVSRDSKVRIAGDLWPTTIEILYTEEEDPDWSITADNFCEFFYQAQKNERIKDLMWRAMVYRDVAAKEELNKLGHCRIGPICVSDNDGI